VFHIRYAKKYVCHRPARTWYIGGSRVFFVKLCSLSQFHNQFTTAVLLHSLTAAPPLVNTPSTGAWIRGHIRLHNRQNSTTDY